ncbi:MAG: cytochrome P450 [Actinophytocola sp.]|nr:cytochrome P450 [Actinophytocola sp.]
MSTAPRHARVIDTLRVGSHVVLPNVATGVIQRREPVMGLADRLQLDRFGIRRMQRLRARHGTGLLRLRVPGRSMALVLSPDDVGTILADAPEPYNPATLEKRASLAHFQPHGVLISRGDARPQRRHLNEAVLDTHQPLHRLADSIVAVVVDEAMRLIGNATSAGELTWQEFSEQWWRIVRRVVLGEQAADDTLLITQLESLRRRANWAYLAPRASGTRQRFAGRLAEYIDHAEAGSVAGLIADTPAGRDAAPYDQVPHWLFAFDAAGMAAYRALALLASHPDLAESAREEVHGDETQQLPFLRASVLESVRLWPTTPLLLRETTSTTEWDGTSLPAGTTLLIYTPFFHRDKRTLSYADRFAPDIWLDGTARENPALVPFSDGPAQCPGENLVLLVSSTLLARLLTARGFEQTGGHRLDPTRPLPSTLNPFALRFAVT